MKKKCLLVFYSRTGMTKKVADTLAAALHCDTEQILDLIPRTGFAGYWRSAYEAVSKKLPLIQMPQKNPAEYTLTIVGTPVWGSNIAAPMRTYLSKNRKRLNNIASFCTMGGSGGNKVLDDIATLCNKTSLAKMALTGSQIEDVQFQEKIAQFLSALSKSEISSVRKQTIHSVS